MTAINQIAFSSNSASWRAVAATSTELKLAFHDADTDADTDILARILADTSVTRDFMKSFPWQAERHADILATILARMSTRMSVSASWNASLTRRRVVPTVIAYLTITRYRQSMYVSVGESSSSPPPTTHHYYRAPRHRYCEFATTSERPVAITGLQKHGSGRQHAAHAVCIHRRRLMKLSLFWFTLSLSLSLWVSLWDIGQRLMYTLTVINKTNDYEL